MVITQTTIEEGDEGEILDVIDDQVRALQDVGVEPAFIVVGPAAYDALRRGISKRFGRSEGSFETYQWLAIVVDPFRGNQVCVLPSASVLNEPVRTEER